MSVNSILYHTHLRASRVLDDSPFMYDSVGEMLPSLGKCGKCSNVRLSGRSWYEEIHDAHDIPCYCRTHVLQVRFWQADVACMPKATPTNALGERALNSRTLAVLLTKLVGSLPLPCGV